MPKTFVTTYATTNGREQQQQRQPQPVNANLINWGNNGQNHQRNNEGQLRLQQQNRGSGRGSTNAHFHSVGGPGHRLGQNQASSSVTTMSSSSSHSSGGLSKSPSHNASVPKPPKVDIVEYYKQHGCDYKTIRKQAKIRVPCGKAKGVVYDTFTPPVGYTTEDLPDSEGLFDVSSEETALSPAVALGSYKKRERKPIISTPELKSSTEIIQNLARLKSRPSKPKQIERMEEKEPIIETRTAVAPPDIDYNKKTDASFINGSFPDDSYNDSMLLLASQQVEEGHFRDVQPNNVLKKDLNRNNKMSSVLTRARATVVAATTPSNPPPITSTPLSVINQPQKVLTQGETPRKPRMGLSRNRNKSSTQKSLFDNSSSPCSLFEMSPIQPAPADDENRMKQERNDGGTPLRKVLKYDMNASPSPIKPLRPHSTSIMDISSDSNKWGEFEDDDDDHLYSQLEMPEVLPAPQVNNVNENQTFPEDSMGDASFMAAMEQMEAMNCNSTKSSNSSSNVTPFHHTKKESNKSALRTNKESLKSKDRPSVIMKAPELPSSPVVTPSTRSLRHGLSLKGRNKKK